LTKTNLGFIAHDREGLRLTASKEGHNALPPFTSARVMTPFQQALYKYLRAELRRFNNKRNGRTGPF